MELLSIPVTFGSSSAELNSHASSQTELPIQASVISSEPSLVRGPLPLLHHRCSLLER